MPVYQIKKEYDWRYKLPIKAQVAGEFLETLEQKYGEITPENILENSRDEKAVLHPCFEWNDGIAAEKYRLEQARYIQGNITIKVVRIENDDEPPKEARVRAFVNVSEEPKGKFISVATALNNDTYKERVLQYALSELLTFKKKYEIYTELAGVCKAIDDFAATLDI